MMTSCGPDRHNLQQCHGHNVMGRGKGRELAQVVANLNVNGVKVVVCLLVSFHHTRQPEGRLLFRSHQGMPGPDPLLTGCTDRSQQGFRVFPLKVVTSLRLVTSPAVQMGTLLEAFGLRILQVEVRNVRWRTAILDMGFLTVLEIFQLSVEDRV